MKKVFLLISLLLLCACRPDETRFTSKVPTSRPDFSQRVTEGGTQESNQAKPLPDVINLEVPFFPQAPDADWGMPWQEACEEASITLAYHFYSEEPLTKERFKSDILGLVDWQNEHFGAYEHSTVEQTAQMLEGYFGFTDYRIIQGVSLEVLKKELAAGHIIVAPFAGRMLNNPYYSGDGPYFHMMIIKGYDEKNFITNDVGTRRGANFIYPYTLLMDALHDYDETAIETAPKTMIILE